MAKDCFDEHDDEDEDESDGRVEGWKGGRMEGDLLEALLQRTIRGCAFLSHFSHTATIVASVRVFPVAREGGKI
jgi:hypothetical protein